MRAALVLLTLAGCGGGGPRDEVRDVARSYFQALIDEDYAKACSLMSETMRENAVGRSTRTCAEGLERTAAESVPSREELAERRDAVSKAQVKLNGEFALLAVTKDGRVEPGSLFLVREGGEWRLHPAAP